MVIPLSMNMEKFALHLLPSGVFYQHTTSIIGNGVALNIPYLIKEIQSLVDRGVPEAPYPGFRPCTDPDAPTMCCLILYEEARLAGKSFGSTKSGIAPFIRINMQRLALQVSELFDEELLREKCQRVCEDQNVLLEHLYHKPLLNADELFDELISYREMIRPYVCDVSSYLYHAIKEGKNILLEGQLGSLKDPDHGIYPMVTSSSTLAAYGAIGAGIAPYEIKKYHNRCEGIFQRSRRRRLCQRNLWRGSGRVTASGRRWRRIRSHYGRPRRVGWFDAVATRYGCRIQGHHRGYVYRTGRIGIFG